MNSSLGVAGLVFAVAMTAGMGCGDQCSPGAAKCDGNATVTCSAGENQPATWHRLDCGEKLCRKITTATGLERAVCSLAPDPDPVCAADPPNSIVEHCAGSTVIECDVGYRVTVLYECGSPALCKQFGTTRRQTVCVVSPDPEPLCAPSAALGLDVRFCAGDRELICFDGYLLRARDCGPGLCYTPAPHTTNPITPYASCVLSTTPDPLCVTPSPTLGVDSESDPRIASGCNGNQFFKCTDGLLAATVDCAPRTCDRPRGNAYANCQPPSPPTRFGL